MDTSLESGKEDFADKEDEALNKGNLGDDQDKKKYTSNYLFTLGEDIVSWFMKQHDAS